MSTDERSRSLSLEGVFEAFGLTSLTNRFDSTVDETECGCSLTFTDETLVVDASECPTASLANQGGCRQTVIRAFETREATTIIIRSNGLEYRYDDQAVTLLAAAGRFIELLGDRDERLSSAARSDPLAVADELRNRADSTAAIASSAGLLEATAGVETYDELFTPTVGVTIGSYSLQQTLVEGARLRDVTHLETGSEARIYTRPDSVALYVLDAVDTTLSSDQRALLIEAYEAIAEGTVEGTRAPSRAVEFVADEHSHRAEPKPIVTRILSKHTTGYGILEDLFADARITDVYVTAPVGSNPVRVVCDGESMATNVHLTAAGVQSLASRVRRTSGRAFSRANPTVDATAVLERGTGVRIAGVSEPVSDGIAFAFREQADDQFTIPALVANETMRPAVGAFLSVAIERNAAALIAGTRGAGKTTLLGTLLYELTPDTRTVVIEDTPELPVRSLQSVDRDVQALRTGTGDGPEITPAAALRTALRLGDGALVVGEIRGEEARVLYEAMRVGANANAVLGTIHGDGAADVYERVVTDLQVEPSSFGATDLVVTAQAYRTPTGKKRRLARIEEVIVTDSGIQFETLYELDGTHDCAVSTGRIDRGESRFIDHLTGPTETYADIRSAIDERTSLIRSLAANGRTSPEEVAAAYARRGQHR